MYNIARYSFSWHNIYSLHPEVVYPRKSKEQGIAIDPTIGKMTANIVVSLN